MKNLTAIPNDRLDLLEQWLTNWIEDWATEDLLNNPPTRDQIENELLSEFYASIARKQ